ncbi:MAG TPA: 16S rRNA (cytidine(1402)-2'-O)-methyltransferase [Gemmatimonadales bacterium]|nr:16S rRNA (cytidine(1402)-2'-O)-methyltransferase [Gemmatimonadales bacterium]
MATLYVVATPLGNLADLSPRAADCLRQVAVVAAEDTRRTRGLLAHLGAHPQLLSFHAHSGRGRTEALLGMLADGRDVALVTDAGTPGVSDPGPDLVSAARDAGFSVVPLPGASAVTAALSASGLPADRYLFLGFMPRKGAERARLLARACAEEWTVVFFEAPGRLAALLRDLVALVGPDRRVVVARELTKLHEELRAGTVLELGDYYSQEAPKGEVTVLLAGTGEPAPPPDRTAEGRALARQLLDGGATRREAAQRVAAELGLARNEAYRLVTEL